MKRPGSFILPLAFITVLIIPMANQVLGIWEFKSTDENRNFQPFPELDITHFEVFPNEFNDYYKDAFSFRTPLLQIYQNFKVEQLKISPSPDQTFIGTDGWLFNSRKEIKILHGEHDFNQDYLDRFETEWATRMHLLDSLKIPAHWYIIPMKHYVYQDKLPFNMWVSEPKRVTVLQDRLNKRFENLVQDPTDLLKTARDSFEIYYRYDNHWNYRGAQVIAQSILKKAEHHFPDYTFNETETVVWNEDVRKGGCHAVAIGKPDITESEWIPELADTSIKEFKYGFTPPPYFPYPNDFEHAFKNPNGNGLKILIIGDSFGLHLQKLIASVFSESVFIFDSWQYDLNKDIILKVEPDLVIWESLETHIDHVIGEE